MTAPEADPGHLLPADEWARVVAEAEAIVRGEHHKLMRAGLIARATTSAFPSITGFVQAKYDGGARPGAPTFGVWHDAETPLAAGYALAIANYFTRCTNSTSAHFMLGPEAGYQLLDTSRIAWHCGNGNPRSIGVENCGYVSFTTAQWETADGDRQMQRGATLLREIHGVHGIEPRWMTDPAEILACHHGEHVGGWITHDQASQILGGSTHTDPMPSYPLQRLMALASDPTPTPTFVEDREMRLIQSPARGIAVVGPGYFKGLTAEQLPVAVACWGDPYVGNDRQFDLAKAIATQGAPAALDPKALAADIVAALPADSPVSPADADAIASKVVADLLGHIRP